MQKYNVDSLLALFRLVPYPFAEPCGKSVSDCMRYGFVVVRGGFPVPVPEAVFDACRRAYGVDGERFNETFHKSFETVRDMAPETYYAQQIAHYLTTYGAEALGIEYPTYVPAEALALPDGAPTFERLTVLRAADRLELREAINRYARETVSPDEKQLALFEPLLPHVRIETERIACFELRVRKHALDGTVPDDPVSLLRYLVYRTTGTTLLIKNRELRERIVAARSESGTAARDILSRADAKQLAGIFLRYKPIFLAYRSHTGCAPIVNRLRRLAVRYHRPLSAESLQNAVQLGLSGNREAFVRLADAASSRGLVKLCNAISVKLSAAEPTPGVYAVRNGKLYVRKGAVAAVSPSSETGAALARMRDLVLGKLAGRLSYLKGRVFLVSPYVDYAVPQSERQFVGCYPWGTRVKTPADTAFTAGIHWFNQQGERVDLDLHLSSATEHYGWNGDYESRGEVVYTGDMTDAPEPDGAAEAYYFDPSRGIFTLQANKYSGPDAVDFRFFLSRGRPALEVGKKNYTFDPQSAAFAPLPLTFTGDSEMNLGVFLDGAFLFYGGRLGNGIVPSGDYRPFLAGVAHLLRCRLMLRELLTAAGAAVVDDPARIPAGTPPEAVVDLTPEALGGGTLLQLVDGTLA